MSYRLLMDYPPAAHMLSILAAGEDEELLSQGMDYLGRFVERIGEKYHLHVIGPAYASVGKINDVYHKVIYLKHQEERVLMDIKDFISATSSSYLRSSMIYFRLINI